MCYIYKSFSLNVCSYAPQMKSWMHWKYFRYLEIFSAPFLFKPSTPSKFWLKYFAFYFFFGNAVENCLRFPLAQVSKAIFYNFEKKNTIYVGFLSAAGLASHVVVLNAFWLQFWWNQHKTPPIFIHSILYTQNKLQSKFMHIFCVRLQQTYEIVCLFSIQQPTFFRSLGCHT